MSKAMSTANPHKCPQCQRWFIQTPGMENVSCTVLHGGGCCHFSETEVADPNPHSQPEGASERFERRAAQFYRDTGMMAPGKDQPAAMGGPDIEERFAAWDAWTKAHPDTPAGRQDG